MFRGVVFGGIAFAAAFLLERQLQGIGHDIARYDRIRAMSGDPPFLRDELGKLLKKLRAQAFAPRDGGPSIVSEFATSLPSDLARYLKMRTM